MCNSAKDTHAANMRTNVDIDDELREQAMRLKGLPTKKATIEEALQDLIRRRAQRKAMDELWERSQPVASRFRFRTHAQVLRGVILP
ncbi:type II toxin-antitoxin system VapB family antitoxin [Rhizobium mongolense]|uniref:type II toxin-antitoxin system VapB family antitoxin n=1 Tax=Rhizobium TaxID=379 RepID=UPI0032C219E3